MKHVATELWSDFPALDLVRSNRIIRSVGRLTLAMFVASVLAMLLLPWQQTAPGTGLVLAKSPQERPQAVKSPVRGIVKYVAPDIREGTFVNKNDLLIRLEPTAEGGVEQLQLKIKAAELQKKNTEDRIEQVSQNVDFRVEWGKLTKAALKQNLEAAQTKWEQAKSELLAAESELVNRENRRRIGDGVFERGLISREELVTRRQDEETQRQTVEKAKQFVNEARAILESTRSEIDAAERDIEIRIRDAKNSLLTEEERLQAIVKELADLEVRRQEWDRLEIRAPQSGTIQQWYGIEGSETVTEDQTLFVLVPEASELAVEMMISGNDMPLVQPGAPVRLQFEGWPAVQFVGWPSVAIGTFGGQVNRIFPTDDGKGNFRVLIVPENHLPHDNGWPDSVYLRQGVRANGWVLLRQVPLGFEIWRQINGFPPSILEDGDTEKLSKPPIPKL